MIHILPVLNEDYSQENCQILGRNIHKQLRYEELKYRAENVKFPVLSHITSRRHKSSPGKIRKSKRVFEMSSSLTDACAQSWPPLPHRFTDDTLIKFIPFLS